MIRVQRLTGSLSGLWGEFWTFCIFWGLMWYNRRDFDSHVSPRQSSCGRSRLLEWAVPGSWSGSCWVGLGSKGVSGVGEGVCGKGQGPAQVFPPWRSGEVSVWEGARRSSHPTTLFPPAESLLWAPKWPLKLLTISSEGRASCGSPRHLQFCWLFFFLIF